MDTIDCQIDKKPLDLLFCQEAAEKIIVTAVIARRLPLLLSQKSSWPNMFLLFLVAFSTIKLSSTQFLVALD